MATKPGFLIIGAMKAGTTSLYDDLRAVPGIYMPPEKEPEDLIYAVCETPEGRAAYFSKFDRASTGEICGEASTAYTKRPTHEGVAARALTLLGPELKLIYMTRHPVRRAISQYHHEWGLGLEKRGLNDALTADPRYSDYSRYEWQLAPWREAFGEDAVLVVAFEEYLSDHPAIMARICDHIGVEPRMETSTIGHRNKSGGKAYVPRGGLMDRFLHSRFYQFGLKPLMSSKLRDRIKAAILPKAPELDEDLAPETLERLNAIFANDDIAVRYIKDTAP